MRSLWRGAVAFGFVRIPVKLYAATESRNVTFRQVHAADAGRVQYRRVCSVDGREVPFSDIAKGYELPDGGMVVLTDDDLANLPLSSSENIEVVEFVPLRAIDPIYFDRGYYLEPETGSVKPYVLLRDALHKFGRVAVAKVTLRQRESLAVLRVRGDVVVMSTMLWPDEVRAPDFPFLADPEPDVRPQELAMAGTLIDSLSDDVFDAGKYHDSYREAVRALIEAKIAGREVSRPLSMERPEMEGDLLAALRASIAAAQTPRQMTSEPTRTRHRSRRGDADHPDAHGPSSSGAKPATRGRSTDRS